MVVLSIFKKKIWKIFLSYELKFLTSLIKFQNFDYFNF